MKKIKSLTYAFLTILVLSFMVPTAYAHADAWSEGSANSVYKTNAGNVGIGTTTPSALLMITNTGTSTSFLVEDSMSPDITPFVIDASGRVGIGTSTPSHKLTVEDTTPAIVLNATDTSTIASVTYMENGVTTGIMQCRGSTNSAIPRYCRMGSNNSTYGTVITSGNGGNNIVAHMNGNTGFGTTTPLYRLTVSGSSNSTNLTSLSNTGAGAIVNLNTTVNTYSPLYLLGADTNGLEEINAAIIGRHEVKTPGAQSSSLIFGTRNVGTFGEKMRIAPNGNVGIGEIAPASKLHVTETANGSLSAPLRLLNNGTATSTAVGINLYTGGAVSRIQTIRTNYPDPADAALVFAPSDSGAAVERMRIDGHSGNVGIGTTTTSERLNVNGNIKLTGSIVSDGDICIGTCE